ncbi:hypothetical protein [Flavobacterium pectinovorum]|nr:hypothetical protein [Flavobacterium pectinovorum]
MKITNYKNSSSICPNSVKKVSPKNNAETPTAPEKSIKEQLLCWGEY